MRMTNGTKENERQQQEEIEGDAPHKLPNTNLPLFPTLKLEPSNSKKKSDSNLFNMNECEKIKSI